MTLRPFCSLGLCKCWVLIPKYSPLLFQEKAFQEQEDIFEGSTRAPNLNDINEMKYLERVIKETLRLYPGIPFYGRQLKEDVKIGK
ncbi:Cytochrome P450 4C1 [Blattella germanica]|nr:Cytochrome P450 4C1 [Blattella germanica]